jgi:hypothetical protein
LKTEDRPYNEQECSRDVVRMQGENDSNEILTDHRVRLWRQTEPTLGLPGAK